MRFSHFSLKLAISPKKNCSLEFTQFCPIQFHYSGAPVALSKKAINQRDADANLFLRFLELDPPVEATTAQSTPAHSTSELRRKSTLKGSKDPAAGQRDLPLSNQTQNQNGRTPFTITKKLQRTADKGFGFSIVWTHPPRIEKVEPGLSADRNGICPGDYVIFVDKLNVVTMPEMDILNLIKAQGNSLVLEVFRRASNGTTVTTRSHINGTVDRMPSIPNSMQQRQQQPTQLSLSNNYNNNNNNEDAMSSEFATPKQSTSSLAPARPTTTCSNTSLTLESTKRRLHLPQVTFSKEVSSSQHNTQMINETAWSSWATRIIIQYFISHFIAT